jgi:uncharacterized protein
MIDRISHSLVKFRIVLAISIIACMAAFLPFVQKAMVPDNALTVWFLESDPQIQDYQRFQNEFGNDEVVLMALYNPDGVINKSLLQSLKDFHTQVSGIEGISRIVSVLDAVEISIGQAGMETKNIINLSDIDSSIALSLLNDNILYNDRLINNDGTALMVWIAMKSMSNFDDHRDYILEQLHEVADINFENIPHPMGGIGVIYSGLNQITQHDFGLFLGLAYLILFVALGFLFRSVLLVIGALLTISFGCILALGIYGLFGYQVNMVTVVLPVLIIIIGIADVIHFPSAFYRISSSQHNLSRKEISVEMLKQVLVPCLLTTITTVAGFLSLASAPMAVIRQLGIFSVIGILGCFMGSVVFMPLMLCIQKNIKKKSVIRGEPLAAWILALLSNHRIKIFYLIVGITCISFYGASIVVTDTYTLKYLPDNHQVVKDHIEIEQIWGSYAVLELLISHVDSSKVTDPKTIRNIERFSKKLKEIDIIRNTFSVATWYRQIQNSMMNPNSDTLTYANILFCNETFSTGSFLEDPNHFLRSVLNEDQTLARFRITAPMMSAVSIDSLLIIIKDSAEGYFGSNVALRPAGYVPLYTKIVDYAIQSQIKSFILAVVLIFMLMLLWMRSIKLALFSLIPNFFPVLIMFATMGFSGIHLDIATATVAAIIIGVAIDDTVHFLFWWRKTEMQERSWEECLRSTLQHVGPAACITSGLLAISFPLLMFAQVKTVFYFGFLTTIAVIAALPGDLIILPLILKYYKKKTT